MLNRQAFLIALQFLTIFPVKLNTPVSSEAMGRSLLFYPLVGLLMGIVLLVATMLLSTQTTLVAAALITALWVVITGGLHLDGLADSADAWLGGLGDKARTLAIMKDPACGPTGVLALLLVLLLKFVAIASLIDAEQTVALLWALLLARLAMPLLFLTTPYQRASGLASSMHNAMPESALRRMLLLVTVTAIVLADIGVVLVSLLVFLLLRYLMERRLDGFTGDTAGAMIELLETTVLLYFVLS
jgi:adenosylcobinamide-GDP ribazoletransferase